MCAKATVAVIDIGSNSIKLLVARPGSKTGSIETVFTKTIETRISTGISKQKPHLTKDAMEAGCRAISNLVKAAQSYQPATTKIVATSAVRDATNAREFTKLVEKATGLEIEILSGTEEAAYICKGLICDPQLSNIENFIQMDIGGGSLELIHFARNKVKKVCSLQLGAVRLTEKFVTDQTTALSAEIETKIRNHVETTLNASNFDFKTDSYPFIATGGAIIITRAMLAAQNHKNIQETSPVLQKKEIMELKSQLVKLPLEERKNFPLLPPTRADIIPAALITILTVLDHANRDTIIHSFYNLRYGIAANLYT